MCYKSAFDRRTKVESGGPCGHLFLLSALIVDKEELLVFPQALLKWIL